MLQAPLCYIADCPGPVPSVTAGKFRRDRKKVPDRRQGAG